MIKKVWILIIVLMGIIPISAQTATPDDFIGDVAFVEWIDPNEEAFTIQVPDGWAIEGGMNEIRGQKYIYYSMMSPQQDAIVMVGQSKVIHNLQPSDDLTAQGYAEGDIVLDEGNYIIKVASYQTGVEAARTLIETAFMPICVQLTITEERDRDDLSGYNETETAFTSVGEVAFTCTIATFELVGYFQATTYATVDDYYGQSWIIRDTYGFLAERSKADQAAAILLQSLTSLIFNEEWIVEQQQIQAQLAAQHQQAVQSNNYQADDWAYYEYMSDMSAMEHETMMAIIYNMDSGYTVEWDYEYGYDW
jgi:hypothetical protein